MAENAFEFENPGEQLRLSNLVNRFCVRKAEEFDPVVHVDEAREIVKALAPKVESFSSRYWFEQFPATSKDPTLNIKGVTDLGEVTAQLKKLNELKPDISLRKEEIYRIGAYMITKFKVPGGFSVLNFKHFMKHGVVNRYMGNFPPYWQIFYDEKSLEPTTISETQSKVREFKIPFKSKPFYKNVGEYPKIVWTTLGKNNA